MSSLPIIDVRALYKEGADRSAMYEQIIAASIEWGAFYMINHEIDKSDLTELYDNMIDFFDLDPNEHPGYAEFGKAMQYTVGKDLGLNGEPDFENRRALFYGRYQQNRVPKFPSAPKLQSSCDQYLSKIEKLAVKLMHAYCEILEIPESKAPVETWTSEIGMFRYSLPKPDEDFVGLNPHTDFGWISFVYCEQPNLEGMDREGNWLKIPPLKNAILAHVSDSLELITNGLFRSYPHRVVRPTEQRHSVVYFLFPPINFTLESVDYPEAIKKKKSKDLIEKRWPLMVTTPIIFSKYYAKSMDRFFPEWREKSFGVLSNITPSQQINGV